MTLPVSPRIDCHIHAIDPVRFPYSADTPYRPSGQEIAPASQLLRVLFEHSGWTGAAELRRG